MNAIHLNEDITQLKQLIKDKGVLFQVLLKLKDNKGYCYTIAYCGYDNHGAITLLSDIGVIKIKHVVGWALLQEHI